MKVWPGVAGAVYNPCIYLYFLGSYSRHADVENTDGQPQLAVVPCRALARRSATTLKGMSGLPMDMQPM